MAALPAPLPPARRPFAARAFKAYRHHVPTTCVEKVFIAVDASIRALGDPRRADLVGVVGETTSGHALSRIRDRMRRDETGSAILSERPRIDNSIRDSLEEADGDSFGGHYARYLDRHGFQPEERTPVRFVDDDELAYVMQRYREVHDLWHVLFGLPPTLAGEIALKNIELVQTGLPMCAMSASFGLLRANSRTGRALLRMVPWALKSGRRAADLMCVKYEDHFGEPIASVRENLRIEPWVD